MVIWCLKDNIPSIEFYKAINGMIKVKGDFKIDHAYNTPAKSIAMTPIIM